jgi:hypothetical protein
MVADGSRMATLKELFPDFFEESRNIILGGCGDGVSPFDNPNRSLSMMCIVFNVFNLPQELRDKYDYLNLWGVYDGLHYKHCVMHRVLVEDLQIMWRGVKVWDSWTKEVFTLRATPLTLLADHPGKGDLTNQNGVGSLAGCYTCEFRGVHCPPLGAMVYHDSQQAFPQALRTHDGMLASAAEAQVCKACPLLGMRWRFSIAYSFVLMHRYLVL